jgi:hypothetical protein
MEMEDDDIFKFLKEPMGTALVRSLAKMAGHPAWRDGDITPKFLEEVRESIRFTQELTATVSSATEAGSTGVQRGEGTDLKEDDESMNVRTGAPNYNNLIPPIK